MQSIQVQDLGRVQTIARVAARNGFGHLLGVVGWSEPTPAADATVAKTPYARRLKQVLVDLGPTFVKFGQILSVRPDILPQEVLEEFQSLQDRVPALPFEKIKPVLEQELGRPLEDVFREFDPKPLGSASIAQVHRARLLDGQEVAVKIQRPGIEQTIRSDLNILYTLAGLAEGRLELPGLYTPTAIVQEFDAALSIELDFFQEARAAQRLGGFFKASEDVVVPRIYTRWSTRKVLVMELIHGRPLSQVMKEVDGPEARRIAHMLMESFYAQVFEHGMFHGDPHPGNLFITDEGRLAFIDFGITGLLTSAMQDTIISAFTALVFRDADTLSLTVYRAGATASRVDLRSLRQEIEHLLVKYHGASLDVVSNPATMMEVVAVAARFRINLPAEFAVLSRVGALVEGECQALLPGIDILEEIKPYATRLVKKRFGPERVVSDMGRLVMQMQGHMRDLPTQVSQVLMDLEEGRLTFNMRDPDAGLLREELRMGVQRLSLALLAGTTSLGSLLFLAAWSPTPFGIPLVGIGGVFLFTTGMSLFLALGVHVLFARFLSLGFWKRRLLATLHFFTWRRG
ncbi:MAG: AarF/ABC1/UbiB kinase family protein [Deltaproteobacteria bacterium]|nr:AarF/ABC1/UbiB kinase family protein [Deltaproteobacteria bacterium]